MTTHLTDLRLFAGEPGTPAVDLTVESGRISAVAPAGSSPAPDGADVVDGSGRLLLPSLGDVHSHLDSNRLGQTFRPHTADGTLHGMIMNDRAHWRAGERGVADQASFALATIIASGGSRVRSHAQVDADCGLERFHGVQEALARYEDIVDQQIVAFPQAGIQREAGVVDLLDQALAEGADLVGGLDPVLYDRDPVSHLNVVFGLCEKHGAGADIHLHEGGTAGLFSMEEIAHRTEALGLQGRVTISHAFALHTNPEPEVARIVERLAEAGISLTTVAPSRGALPQRLLTEHRMALGLGEDGQRDHWSPYGDGDLLRRTWQLAFTNGFRHDADVERCVDVASRGGAQVMAGARPDGTPLLEDGEFGLGVGARADFFLLEADTVTAAVMDCPSARDVFVAGRLVASGGELIGGVR